MRVDGRDITVSGSLLQPLTRRTNDIIRLALAAAVLIAVVTSSLITRPRWVALEKSISEIVGVLSPTQSDLVYLVYGIAILALPFVILIGLILSRQWKLLGAYGAAAFMAVLPLSISSNRIAAPRWHLDLSEKLSTVPAQFLDDPRWIAMLAAVLTVSGPWLPARWRHWWWALLLAFVPIHLVISAIVPARAVVGLSVGWFVGAFVVLVVGTPALEVPLDGAVRAMAKRGFLVSRLLVVRPGGPGPLVLSAESTDPGSRAAVELYGPHQRSGGALRQLWWKLRLRGSETAPLQTSMRRAVEHRALMAIAIADTGVANTSAIALAALDRGWTMYAHQPVQGTPLDECANETPVAGVWKSLRVLNDHQISHGDLRCNEITVADGKVLFGGFGAAEYGATDAQLQSDIAQLLVTTSALYDAESAVGAAIESFGKDTILTASRRLTKSAVPKRIRESVANAKAVMAGARAEVQRQTGADQIESETITRFSRSQFIQLVLIGALVYVAYPFISTVPTFFPRTPDGELVVGAAGSGGVSADLRRGGRSVVGLRGRIRELCEALDHAGSQHFCGDDHAGRCRWPGAEHPLPAEGWADRPARHGCGGTAANGSGDRALGVADLVQCRGRDIDRPLPFRTERHRALPDRRCGAGHHRHLLVGAQPAALAGNGTAPQSRGGNP